MSKKPPDKEKTSRPDRTKKLLERQTTSESVVKQCLRKAIRGNDDLQDKIVEEVKKRVVTCSQRVHLTSLALNLLVQEVCEGHQPTSSLNNIWNINFIRNIMVGERGKNDVINSLFERYPLLFENQPERYNGDGNIYTHAAKKMLVNMKNHLVMNTIPIMKKVIYSTITDRDQAVLALFKINGWVLKAVGRGKSKRDVPDMLPFTENFVRECRKTLDLEENEVMGKQWFTLADSISKMLRFRIYALKKLEEFDNKLYNILPISRIKTHFVTLDSMGIWGVCRSCDLTAESLYITNKDGKQVTNQHLIDQLWTKYFRTSGSGDRNFSGTIDSDGIALNIHYLRPKNHLGTKEKEEFIVDSDIHRVVGVDTGRVVIACCGEQLEDGSIREYRLTRSQYYRESGSFDAIRHSNTWNNGKDIKPVLEELSQNSPKGVSLSRFLKYIEVYVEHKDVLWTEYLKSRWPRQRLRTYGGKKRVFAKFFNKIENDCPIGKQTIMAYGSAKFAPGGKGEISVPTTRVYKEFCYRFPTIPTDEFRSTRVHWEDDSLLAAVGQWKKSDKQIRTKEAIRGLLWCHSTNQYKGKLVNRDLNAALNMRRIVLFGRPDALNRKKQTMPLPKKNPIEKVLKLVKAKRTRNRLEKFKKLFEQNSQGTMLAGGRTGLTVGGLLTPLYTSSLQP